MKRYLVAATVLILLLAPAAVAVDQTLNQRVSRLERQVRALQNTNRELRGNIGDIAGVLSAHNNAIGQIPQLVQQVGTLNGQMGCLQRGGVYGLTRYGGGGTGYMWWQNDIFITTAVDFTGSGHQVHAYIAGIDRACVRTTTTAVRSPRVGNSVATPPHREEWALLRGSTSGRST